jgi:beta-glucosidase
MHKTLVTFSIVLCAGCTGGIARLAAPPLYLDVHQTAEQRATDLVSHLTPDEKIAQLTNDTPAVPHLGIPAYNYWTEALHGAVGHGTSTVFPQSIGLGATWDPALLGQITTAVSDELRAKHHDALRKNGGTGMHEGLTIFAPNINLLRDPRWGRAQETYGEDPLLTETMAVAYVRGLQGDDPTYLKTIATAKHFAVHSGPDALRLDFDAVVSPHDLYDSYLPHFEAAVRRGGAQSVMCSYNRVNGLPACANPELLVTNLRERWNFGGFVTTDCDAIYFTFTSGHAPSLEAAAAASLKAGVDISCGPEYHSLVQALGEGLVTQADIDRALVRLFTARFRLGMFDPPSQVPYAQIPYSVVESPEHQALALQAARESLVLLKNDGGLLPLAPGQRKIAVIGPNADDPNVLLGNYNGVPSSSTTPLAGIRARAPAGAQVVYAPGSSREQGTFHTVASSQLAPAGGLTGPGLRGEYFTNMELAGDPALLRVDATVDFDWSQVAPAPAIPREKFSARWTGALRVGTTSTYQLGMTSDDGVRVYLDGQLIVDAWHDQGQTRNFAQVDLTAGRAYDLRIEYYQNQGAAVARFEIADLLPSPDALLDAALAAARAADVSILVLGISEDQEGETFDRRQIELPFVQDRLLRAVVALGRPVVVVYLNGAPVSSLAAQQKAGAILEAWYPGQAGGTAIAEALWGDTNPGGHLPVTVAAATADLAPFTDYAMASGHTYRYLHNMPLYPFGYGLSYSHFAYVGITAAQKTVAPADTLPVQVTVRNTSTIAGDEVVQLYLAPAQPPAAGPVHRLVGFQRVHLAAGETRAVDFAVTPASRAFVDAGGAWQDGLGWFVLTAAGQEPRVSIAGGAGGARAQTDFAVK